MIAPDQTVVVAGNGPSLRHIVPGRVLADDLVVRTNNFFFEDHYWLGRRVDLAFVGGDPRVAPFLFETLYQHGRDYLLAAWSSHHSKVAVAGRVRFAGRYTPFRYRDAGLARGVAALIVRYQRKPMTGTYAALMAHGYGAQTILLAGIDLYAAPARYVFSTGEHHRALLGANLNQRGPDGDQHNPDLDRAILDLLAAQSETQLLRCTSSVALNDVLPLAPVRQGVRISITPRVAPADWVSRAGLYPITLLRALRQVGYLRRLALKGM
jgi:hypothetical protein